MPGASAYLPIDAVSLFGGDIPALLYDDPAQGGDGTYVVNPQKLDVKFQWQTGQVSQQFPFTLAANQQTKFTVRINPEEGMRGDTELCSFMLTSSDRVAVLPYIPILDKYLANTLIPSNLMFGTAQLPALMPSTLFNLPSTLWSFDIRELGGVSNTVSPVFFGRRFLDRGKERITDQRRAAYLANFMHPYWLGPTSAYNNTSSVAISPNPTIAIPSGATVTVTYSVPSTADFDCRWILDDSTSSTAVEISELYAQSLTEGGSARGLIDVPPGSNGLPWRSFIASPTVPVTGFPSGGSATATGGIRAASLPSPAGGWSHLFKRGTDIQIVFRSTDAGTITLRTALAGVLVYASDQLGAISAVPNLMGGK